MAQTLDAQIVVNENGMYPVPRIKRKGEYARVFLSDSLLIPSDIAAKIVQQSDGSAYAIVLAHAAIGETQQKEVAHYLGEGPQFLDCVFEDGKIKLFIPNPRLEVPCVEWVRVYDSAIGLSHLVFKIKCQIG